MQSRNDLRRFCCSEDGTAVILWSTALVAVLGLVAMSFDVGRVGATHSELQSFADNVALAAAGELDGKADAIDRATAAAENLISDSQTFANGSQSLSGALDYTLTFYSSIPVSDLDAMDPNDITTNPAEAVYAEVVVEPRTISMLFAAATNALVGNAGDGTATIGASAVAGFTQEACDITPLMFCLPTPSFKAEEEIGTQVLLRSGGGSNAWGPGNFGYLDPSRADLGATCAGLSGAQLMVCLFGAEQNVTQCYTQRGVQTEPGQNVGNLAAALNVRFDIYHSSVNNRRTNPTYAPAPNVIKGIVPSGGGSCIGQNADPSPDTVGLPRDGCFAAGTCTRWGDGVWDYDAYVDANHGDGNGVLDAGEDSHLTAFNFDPKWSGTRYETYLREIAHAESLSVGGPILSGRAETGRNMCSPNISTRPERRVIVAAGVDCATYPPTGSGPVPVEEFFEIFLTDPIGMDGTSNFDIWVEVIGSAGGDGYSSAGPGGIFRDVVQLYR